MVWNFGLDPTSSKRKAQRLRCQVREHRGDKKQGKDISVREGGLSDKLTEFCKSRLLIVDELGYLPFERQAAHLFFQLVNLRYEKGSLLVTTNQRVSEWGIVFGDEVLATAILDRLLHHSHTLMITGESYRLREKRKSGLIRSRLASTDLEKAHREPERLASTDLEKAHREPEVKIEKGPEKGGKNR